MSKINLYNHQLKTVKELWNSIKEGFKKILIVIPTGGGKSVVMSFIAENLKGRTLILTHRTEILEQNSAWVKNCGILTADKCNVSYKNNIVYAMVETLNARIKKYGINYIGEFDNIIVDEAHIQVFNKVIEEYNPKLLIGLTATPTTSKKEVFEIDSEEYNKIYTMADFYDKMIVGASVPQLILDGYLVQDRNYVLQLPNFDKLKNSNSNPDGYTSQSLYNLYSNTASLKILKDAYNKICKGKKTLIFNATTKVNIVVLKMFQEMGINVKSYDSVNSKSKERSEVVRWFDESRDGVLIGTNVFTTGFNVTDVECVIINRATKSLNLFIQMAGRGSRTTKKIFKDHFNLIDLGQNIDRHGKWSDNINWHNYFVINDLKPKKKFDLLNIWECENCGTYNTTGELKCINCGQEKTVKKIKKRDKNGKIIELENTIFPRANNIINYTKSNGEGANFAFKLLDEKIIDLFKNHKVTKTYYESRKSSFKERIKKIYIPIYFAIIRDSELKGRNRKLNSQLNIIYKKIDDYYGIKTN